MKQSDHNALLYYQAAVDAGDPSAKFTLGTWYYQGRSVSKDVIKSYELQLSAAEAGHPAAMFNIGCLYMTGEGILADIDKAIIWFEKAAKNGIIQAGVNLGNIYRNGTGVTKDLNKARKYFIMFADKSNDCRDLLLAIDEDLKMTSK